MPVGSQCCKLKLNNFSSRDGCRPLPTSMMKQFLFLVAGFAFISHISKYF